MESSFGPVAPVFCTIVPPHVLDRLAQADDPGVHGPARRALDLDAGHRGRRLTVARSTVVAEPAAKPSNQPNRTISDARHGYKLPGTKVRTEGQGAVKDGTVNRAYDGLGHTFELFLNAFSRHSIDDRGLPMNSSVHYGEDYDNAFWDGHRMVFGDGDSIVFTDFTLSLDVIGHELSHGVTQYTANLDYQGPAGALNESVSDVFGSLVKQYTLGQTAAESDWLIGADILTDRVQGVALRSLRAPGTAYDDELLGKDPQPATMAGYVETDEDNGGVHINSGIPNHAFYLAASALGGHAWERAGRIWYDVLTGGELEHGADFAAFARLTVAAARSRYGEGEEVRAVAAAWAAVGLAVAGAKTTIPAQPGGANADQAEPAP